jgi:uncharacterized protein (DUF488 family)
MQIFTIGHSNQGIKEFIELLYKHEITAVADVRSHPYSRYLPHFSQPVLKQSLESDRIRYVFLGKELGARPDNPDCYIEGKALYAKIAATDLFAEGIKRIREGIKKYRIALMCAEKDPLTCHRTILICHHLQSYDLEINHIKSDGMLESQMELEKRLLAKYGWEHLSFAKTGKNVAR